MEPVFITLNRVRAEHIAQPVQIHNAIKFLAPVLHTQFNCEYGAEERESAANQTAQDPTSTLIRRMSARWWASARAANSLSATRCG